MDRPPAGLRDPARAGEFRLRGLSGSGLRGLAFGALALLSAVVLSVPAEAAKREVASSGGTGFAGQRNVVYIQGRGYWIFLKMRNSDRSVWRFSPDGLDWKA
ncbi:MAG: hypothetical protein FD126_3306, partial [Elusimicrobia bacterium]